MKRLLMALMVCFFLAGCGTAARQSEFWDHSTMYQSWRHMGFSWCGYKKTTNADARNSRQEKWWGIPFEAGQQVK